jgi:type I restriction enzyme S subunit
MDRKQLPEGWKVKTIGSVVTVINGGTPKSEQTEYWNGEIFWITPKDMGKLDNIYVSNTIRKITQLGLERSSAKVIPQNSIILSTRAPIGHLAINQVPMATNQGCRGLIPTSDLDTKLLFYFLKLNIQLLNDLGTGTTFKELSSNSLKGIKIPVPPLDEQKRIVAILDEAFEGIDQAIRNTEKNLANARELFDSYLNKIFTQKGENWEDKKIDDICSKVEYGSSSKSKPEGTIPVLRMGNIQNGSIDWSDLVYSDDQEEIEKYLLKYNDVLFNRTNSDAHVGKTAINKSNRQAIFAGYLIRIDYKKEIIDPDFLNFYLNSYRARDYGKSVMSRSVNQANINGTKLKEYPIPLPPLFLQKLIVENLVFLSRETQRLETIYRKKLAALNELKQSILQKAFTGQLTSKNC